MHHRSRSITTTTTAATTVLLASVAALFAITLQQQEQQTAFASTVLQFVKSQYIYSSGTPHYWFYAEYNAYNYGSNGQLISWYQDYKWWYSYAGWNGPWTYWGEQDYLVCSVYSYSQPCSRV